MILLRESILSVHSAGLSDVWELLRMSYREAALQSQQTEGHSFGDHLISAVLRHQGLHELPVIEICSVALCLV
jgi:hypothetical protein